MMKSLSSLGIGLSLVFGCLFLALLAELYYVFWWKKRMNRDIEDEYRSSARELFHIFCASRPSSLGSTAVNPQEICSTPRNEQSQQPDSTKDVLLKPFGEEGLESELIRLHHFCPPRFLFTIKEETREDLESEDGKSRCARSRKGSRNKSLADLLLAAETPFATPLASPPLFAPALTPLDYYHTKFSLSNGFNPLFEASTEGELHLTRSSPPPKFKFLRDAEEKLMIKLVETQKLHKNFGAFTDEKVSDPNGFSDQSAAAPENEEDDGSFITIIINENAENQHVHLSLSGSTQVLPLESSPPENAKPDIREPI